MRIHALRPTAPVALAVLGAAFVVPSIHGVLPLGGVAAQVLSPSLALGAPASLRASLAAPQGAKEARAVMEALPRGEADLVRPQCVPGRPVIPTGAGLGPGPHRLYRETPLDAPTQLILLDLVGFKV